jgi:predicted transcriptional regulator
MIKSFEQLFLSFGLDHFIQNQSRSIDFTLLKRMLSPSTVSKEKWLQKLCRMKIKDANVVDVVPIFPLATSIIEIAQALIYYYAVLVIEDGRKTGIVTRADFLKLMI